MSNSELIKFEADLIKRVGTVISITNKLLALSEKSIKEVTIGDQVWMAENLNVSNFRNGDLIPEAKTDEEWDLAGRNQEPAWCYYENDPSKGVKYGKLYNWYAVNDQRGLAPEGWHVPSDVEWDKLINYLGGEDIAGIKMKSENGWENNGNGTNESGFLGLAGGERYYDGDFGWIDNTGNWWSSTKNENYIYIAWFRIVGYKDGYTCRDNEYMGYGFSVRCLRDLFI